MEESSNKPSFLKEIEEILNSVKGHPLSVEERVKKTAELSAILVDEANRKETFWEKLEHSQIARLMHDPVGKAFTTDLTDQCFRSKSNRRTADQIDYLIHRYGIPTYLSLFSRLQLTVFRLLTPTFSRFLIPLVTLALRHKTSKVILPGETSSLLKHIEKRKEESVRVNLNHLGEAILGEKEAKKRLGIYLEDLENPAIDYVSIKISTVYSQINLLAKDYTIEQVAKQLRKLYKAAQENTYTHPNGTKSQKFVNLDMEEHKDLHLTVEVFQKVLDEPEFFHFFAGIALQAYLPDSHKILQQLTEWATKRVENGGAPIKVRLVKGANLANEQVEASIRIWPQSPYSSKLESDANYKRMMIYACTPEHVKAVRLSIASHNIFDVSFALLLRAEQNIEEFVSFEMLEGMADHIRRTVQEVTKDVLVYCPVALRSDFQYAISYLIRRLDENTGPENFLRHLFSLKPDGSVWEEQFEAFSKSCSEIETVLDHPRREQNQNTPSAPLDSSAPFENEPDTDFSIPANQQWGQKIASDWQNKTFETIPLVIDGEEIRDNEEGVGIDPSLGQETFYKYCQADTKHIDRALETATQALSSWSEKPLFEKNQLFIQIAQKFRENRGNLAGVMMRDAGKIIVESDVEISEAIDNVEYYRRRMEKMISTADLKWKPKGVILVTPPWNFPCAIPLGGICAALITGNTVIFKPAPETVLTGWHVVNILWEAGVPKNVLQFINCVDEPVGESLIKDPRVSSVVLTGATETALKFLNFRPDLNLCAETGGKNAMIVSALSDRDLAIQDLILSSFGHAGQKCSACSLAILEAEVYDDSQFMKQLKDATESLFVGSAHDLRTKVGPLIHAPNEALARALTTLEEGEEWLLAPKQDPQNPNLYSPGIKLGVKLGSFMQQTELFGPVLGIIRAENFEKAVEIANSTQYGLTAGLHSLDEREHQYWLEHIEAGNCYINRTMTGAIIRRQPFGGCKNSSFGNQTKAGGPNYLREYMHVEQIGLPRHKQPINEAVNSLIQLLDKLDLSAELLGTWTASVTNYAYWSKRMHLDRDPSKLLGQDNLFRYMPRKDITLRIEPNTSTFDALRAVAAALSCSCPMVLSFDSKALSDSELTWADLGNHMVYRDESEEEFLTRIRNKEIKRVRYLTKPSELLLKTAAEVGCYLATETVLANGRYELLNYLRELSISSNYHRYGNLGVREGELRKPIL